MKVSVPAVAPPTAARNRRIDHLQPGLGRQLADMTGAVDVDGRAVDQQRALGDVGQHVVLVDAAHVATGRQHGDHDLGALYGFGGRRRPSWRTLLDGAAEGRCRQVERRYLMLALDQVGGHRAAHVAKTDEGDLRHVILPFNRRTDRSRPA
jgi:hypothetical protein